MYFQFLIEDRSGKILVEEIMSKLCGDNGQNVFDCKFFHGIGGFTSKNTVKETKTGKLLNDLATYLRGFDKSLRSMGREAAVFIVLDNDTRNTEDFRKELADVAEKNNICIDHVFCVAIEEMEAWLLGDSDAVKKAYPDAKINFIRNYEQDSICGTWEVLAEAIYKGGLKRLREECTTFVEIGSCKCEWAKKIGQFMDVDSNLSPSFNYFVDEVRKRLSA